MEAGAEGQKEDRAEGPRLRAERGAGSWVGLDGRVVCMSDSRCVWSKEGYRAALSRNGRCEQLRRDFWVLVVPRDFSQGPRNPQSSPANRCTPAATGDQVGRTGRALG